MKEWIEIQKCPLENVTIQPLNDGQQLNEWFVRTFSFLLTSLRHGNIRGFPESEWHGIVVHFVISFPTGYPAIPPKVRFCSFIPHLNVLNRGGHWELCLDMLENPPLGSFTFPYQYWSSAYSVRSVLLQMTSFLLAHGQPTEVIIILFLFCDPLPRPQMEILTEQE
jgi:ubiquitin-protein ligase